MNCTSFLLFSVELSHLTRLTLTHNKITSRYGEAGECLCGLGDRERFWESTRYVSGKQYFGHKTVKVKQTHMYRALQIYCPAAMLLKTFRKCNIFLFVP